MKNYYILIINYINEMKSEVRLKQFKKRGANGWCYHPYFFKKFRFLCESLFPEGLIGANSECEWLFDEKGKEFFCYCSSGTPISMRFKYMINVVLKNYFIKLLHTS